MAGRFGGNMAKDKKAKQPSAKQQAAAAQASAEQQKAAQAFGVSLVDLNQLNEASGIEEILSQFNEIVRP